MGAVRRLDQLVAHPDLDNVWAGDAEDVNVEIAYLTKVQPHSIGRGQLIGEHLGCNPEEPMDRI